MTARPPARRDVLRLGLLGLAGVPGAAALSACSPADPPLPGPTGPVRGGTLTVGLSQTLVPGQLVGSNFTANHVSGLLFDTLVRHDERLRPTKHLADGWTLSPDRLTVTVRLRGDVRFHDGQRLTADDVVATTQAVRTNAPLGFNLTGLATRIADVRATGPLEVAFTLTDPTVQFFDLLAGLPVLPAGAAAGLASGTEVVGTGPFVWDEWQAGESLTLRRNESWWARPVLLDSVVLTTLDSAGTMRSAVRTGAVHVVNGVTADDAEAYAGMESVRIAASGTNGQGFYLGCNVRRGPLRSRQVRQAVAQAVDRDRIVEDVFGGSALATALPFGPDTAGWFEDLAQRWPYDPAAARAAARQAGYAGEELTLAYKADVDQSRLLAEILQFGLQEAGFRVALRTYDVADFNERLRSGRMPDLWVNGHAFAGLDPATLVSTALAFRAGENASGFDDPRYEDLVRRVSEEEMGSPERRRTVRALAELVVEEQFVVELCIETQRYVHRADVHGVGHAPYGQLLLDQAWVGRD